VVTVPSAWMRSAVQCVGTAVFGLGAGIMMIP
jgi:hypothetical protein